MSANSWTVQDVKQWINSWDIQYSVTQSTIRNLIKFADINNIDGQQLIYFTKDDLKKFGLNKKDIKITIHCINELIIGSYIDFRMSTMYNSPKKLEIKLPPKPSDSQQKINSYTTSNKHTSSTIESKQEPPPPPTDPIESDDDWEKPFSYPKPSIPAKSASRPTNSSSPPSYPQLKSKQYKQQRPSPQKYMQSNSRQNRQNMNTKPKPKSQASTNPFDMRPASSTSISTNPFDNNYKNPNPAQNMMRIPPNEYIENNRENQEALQSIAGNKDVHKAGRSAMNDKNIKHAAFGAMRGGGNDANANMRLAGALAKNKQVQGAAISVAKDKKVQKAAWSGVKKNATRKNAKKAKRLLSFNI